MRRRPTAHHRMFHILVCRQNHLSAQHPRSLHRSLPDSPLLERILHHRRNQLHKPGFNRPQPGVVHPRRPQTPLQARIKRNLHPPPRQHPPHPPGPLTPHAITLHNLAGAAGCTSIFLRFTNHTRLSFSLFYRHYFTVSDFFYNFA